MSKRERSKIPGIPRIPIAWIPTRRGSKSQSAQASPQTSDTRAAANPPSLDPSTQPSIPPPTPPPTARDRTCSFAGSSVHASEVSAEEKPAEQTQNPSPEEEADGGKALRPNAEERGPGKALERALLLDPTKRASEPDTKAHRGPDTQAAAEMSACRTVGSPKGVPGVPHVQRVPPHAEWWQESGRGPAGSRAPTSRKLTADEEFPVTPYASVVDEAGVLEKVAPLDLADVPLAFRSLNVLVVCPGPQGSTCGLP